MPDPESFDAFYGRTVWSLTSQMHELAGDDGLADHAIREAYAKAYQQWYQVSGYSDPEGWVLATARDAYERRSAEAGERNKCSSVLRGRSVLVRAGRFFAAFACWAGLVRFFAALAAV